MKNALASILKNEFLGQSQEGRSNGPSNIIFGLPHLERGNLEDDLKNIQLEQMQSNFLYLQRRLLTCPSNIKQEISIDSRVMHGNPVFKGTRVPLYRIIEELADGTKLEELINGYPSLNLEQIQVGLDFAAFLLRIYDD